MIRVLLVCTGPFIAVDTCTCMPFLARGRSPERGSLTGTPLQQEHLHAAGDREGDYGMEEEAAEGADAFGDETGDDEDGKQAGGAEDGVAERRASHVAASGSDAGGRGARQGPGGSAPHSKGGPAGDNKAASFARAVAKIMESAGAGGRGILSVRLGLGSRSCSKPGLPCASGCSWVLLEPVCWSRFVPASVCALASLQISVMPPAITAHAAHVHRMQPAPSCAAPFPLAGNEGLVSVA